MEIDKKEILEKLCYTKLVYGRIRKKLSLQVSNNEIEVLIKKTIQETPLESFKKIGKNYYIRNVKRGVSITVNSFTTRVITTDKIIQNRE